MLSVASSSWRSRTPTGCFDPVRCEAHTARSWQSASPDRLHRRSLHGSMAILLSILRSAEKVATICEEPQLMPDVHVRVALPTRLLEKTRDALFGEPITTILHRTSCLMLFYRVSKLPHSRAKCVRDQVHQELSDGT